MGTGIGIVASRVAGLKVKFVELNTDSRKKSLDSIKGWCQKEIAKERLNEEEKLRVIDRISYHDSISDLNDIDFVIEVKNPFFILKI